MSLTELAETTELKARESFLFVPGRNKQKAFFYKTLSNLCELERSGRERFRALEYRRRVRWRRWW